MRNRFYRVDIHSNTEISMQIKNVKTTYFKIAAGNPTLFVPRGVSKMKWSTCAMVAAEKTSFSLFFPLNSMGNTNR